MLSLFKKLNQKKKCLCNVSKSFKESAKSNLKILKVVFQHFYFVKVEKKAVFCLPLEYNVSLSI